MSLNLLMSPLVSLNNIFSFPKQRPYTSFVIFRQVKLPGTMMSFSKFISYLLVTDIKK